MASIKESNDSEMLIVGIGASAGGLDPIKQFVGSLPNKTGMAFIAVMHMDPNHESKLADILQSHTALNTLQVTERCKIKSDHIYVTPPDKLLFVKDNYLELSELEEKEQSLTAIDLFFRSLGNTMKRNAAAIILSGTGTDGLVGIKSIKEQGGLTISQYPEEVDYSSMARGAIKTGVIDKVLPIEEMYQELERYKENLSKIDLFENEDQEKVLHTISRRLKYETGHDISSYKRSTVLRRIERRMQVNNCLTLHDYLEYLDEYPEENEKLYRELLISVTSFFRNPEAFEAFKKIIPDLFKNKDSEDQLRIWVPGTATGEEAYSIAILLQDYMSQKEKTADIKIFGSDIDQTALDQARKGAYPESIAAHLTEDQLTRYFEKVDHEYHVKDEIREMVLFTYHNLLSDPPFSKLDLIACRNVLIYLKQDVQKEVFQLFKYALRPGGWLFLGMSDSSIASGELFEPVDKKHQIFQKSVKDETNVQPPQLPLQYKNDTPSRDMTDFSQKQSDIEKFHRNMLMRLYTPQSIIVNEKYEVIDATEDINEFLKYSGDLKHKNVLRMVNPELKNELQDLLSQAGVSTGKKQAIVESEEKDKKTEIMVRSLGQTGLTKDLIHIILHEVPISHNVVTEDVSEAAGLSQSKDKVIKKQENELNEVRERLHVTEEEYQMANEQLRNSNAELQSMNEELQSVNEELENSREELQAVNEELESKVQELRRTNSDLKNLMGATEVAILILGNDFRVHRYNDNARSIFDLTPSDLGRPLDDVTHKLNYGYLNDDIKYVLDTYENIEKVVSSKGGDTFMMRFRPYRSINEKVDGVVLSFMEITELREAKEKLKQQEFQDALITLGTYALGSKDLKSIMDRAIQQTCAGLETNYACHLFWNADEEVLELYNWYGWEPQNENLKIAPDPKWDIGYSFEKEDPIVTTDYTTEERFNLAPFLEQLDITSGITMKIAESDEICGVIGLYTKEEVSFTENEVKFVQNVANILGMASERIKTRERLEISNEKLEREIEKSEQYQREILQNSITERWNLGGYLHDNLAQDLVSIKVMISSLQSSIEKQELTSQIDMILENIDQGIEDIRNLTHEIIPVDIEDEGVAHAFRLLVRQLQKTHNINCILEIGEVINRVRNKKIATNLYHIIQEAVKNAAIHGKAENVVIETVKEDDQLKLKITDDGIGLSQAKSDNDIGSGTNIMRHRIELLGGSFERMELSEKGETGTRVVCSLPLEQLEKSEKG